MDRFEVPAKTTRLGKLSEYKESLLARLKERLNIFDDE